MIQITDKRLELATAELSGFVGWQLLGYSLQSTALGEATLELSLAFMGEQLIWKLEGVNTRRSVTLPAYGASIKAATIVNDQLIVQWTDLLEQPPKDHLCGFELVPLEVTA